MDKPALPKFSSFKPKSSSSKEVRTPKERSHSDRDKSKPLGTHERHECNSYDDHRFHQDVRRHRNRRRSLVRSTETGDAVVPDESEESHLFIDDRQGDRKNVDFGSLHRYSVPAYHRAGHGNVIGAPKSSKIDKDRSTDRDIYMVLGGQDRLTQAPRLLTSKHWRRDERHLTFITHQSLDMTISMQSDFVELSPSPDKLQRRFHSLDESSDYGSLDYRSIEGSAKVPTQPKGEDPALASQLTSGEQTGDLDALVRQENAVLSKQAKARPAELSSWLELADHQAKLIRPGADVASFTTSERRALADLKLTILNNATKYILKGTPCRERLLLAVIEEGSFIWDSNKLASKWREVLEECPASISLWAKYLDFLQSQASFKFEVCRDAYIKCLSMIRIANADRDNTANDELGKIQIFMLLRLTSFMRDAGYDELAIGIWQAVLELHFFAPEKLQDATYDDRLALLEVFWESDAPRIGEEGAQGWLKHDEDGYSAKRTSPRTDLSSLHSPKPSRSFAKSELDMQGQILPASLDDEAVDYDPFRCVMFSDIRDIVEPLGMALPKEILLNAYIHFTGLPVLPPSENGADVQHWSLDPYLAQNSSHAVLSDRRLQAANIKMRRCRETLDTLFNSAFDFSKDHIKYLRSTGGCLARIVDVVLEKIVNSDINVISLEYYLAYKMTMFPEEAAKTAKRLLKARPSSLRLYNAFALIQLHSSGIVKALEVWSMALSMRSKLSTEEQDDAVLLWHARLLAQIRKGREEEALDNLLSLTASLPTDISEDRGTHIQQLKTVRYLQNEIDRMLVLHKYFHATAYVDCLTWLYYLANSKDLAKTLEVYRKYILRMSKQDLTLPSELLLQAECTLLEIHISRRRSYKRAFIWQEVRAGLRMFPNNSILLALQASVSTQDRLRSVISEPEALNTTTVSMVQWSYSLAEALCRMGDEAPGSTANNVRSIFTKALSSRESLVRHAPALWMTWLRFEHDIAVSRGDSLQKVRQVFLDGLLHLPWHKLWVLTGMMYLMDNGLGKGELEQVYEAMVERGLRIRTPNEEPV